jgi:hypothetical protein
MLVACFLDCPQKTNFFDFAFVAYDSTCFLSPWEQQHVLADTLRSVAVLLAGSLSFFTNLISPAIADASAALVVSLVIFLSCVPLVRGMAKTLQEIITMRQSPLMAYWKNTSSATLAKEKNNVEFLV